MKAKYSVGNFLKTNAIVDLKSDPSIQSQYSEYMIDPTTVPIRTCTIQQRSTKNFH